MESNVEVDWAEAQVLSIANPPTSMANPDDREDNCSRDVRRCAENIGIAMEHPCIDFALIRFYDL